MKRSPVSRRATILTVLAGALVAVGALTPSASARLVSVGHGRVIGITAHANLSPGAIPGAVRGPASPRGTAPAAGTLLYGGGQVLHSTKPYLVFWDPSSRITARTRAVITSYFTGAAADSGKATNVYSVDRQFTDKTGFADYQQTFSASSQVINDGHSFPPIDTANCPDTAASYPHCVTDAQIQSEIQRLITADGLPTGSGANAPIYFVMTPDNTNVCADSSDCADNVLCAYHFSFTDGPNNVLYAATPLFFDGASGSIQDPKDCQFDNNAAVQKPNGDVLADVGLKYISHEFNETITDPFGDGWISAAGQEDGDECNFYNATADPDNDGNPDAFLPTLGGSASAGTLYDQVINGGHYYTQSEWSNQGLNCRMQPTSAALTAAFTSSAAVAGTAARFSPSGSSSAAGYSSTTWSWGDGTADTFARKPPVSVTHTFSTAGPHTVTLTLVDKDGNLRTASHTITVAGVPAAAFSFSPPHPLPGSSVSFDGSASTDTGATLSSYSWTFGDGTRGTGQTTSHTYAAAGSYTVTLTVSDGSQSSSITHAVTVDPVPSAAFSVATANPAAGTAVAFDGTGSTGTGLSYSWNFGDGSSPGTGSQPSHAYAAAGPYTVTLTVTDQDGHTATVSHTVTVHGGPTASIIVDTTTAPAGSPIAFDASRSTESNGTIASYAWDFGDGSTGSGATTSHPYPKAGTYTVTLTVTDAAGATATATQAVKITGVPIAEMALVKHHPIAGVSFGFRGTPSADSGSTLVSYAWTFGDGGTATGAKPSHTYRKTGAFTITLTITDASGSTATTSQRVVVKAAAITVAGASIGRGRTQLLFTLNGPGTLRIGSVTIKVRRPRTVAFTIHLSRAQRATLAGKHKLTLRYRVSFTPLAGRKRNRTVSLTLRK
jgi:PKD repeat protein